MSIEKKSNISKHTKNVSCRRFCHMPEAVVVKGTDDLRR